MNMTTSFRSLRCFHATFQTLNPDIPHDLIQACSSSTFFLAEQLHFNRKWPANTTMTPLIPEVL